MAKTILTVDDSKTIRDMVAFTLRNAGYGVTEAVDGTAGLAEVNRQKFDCIITDLNMPGMDGLALTRAIRGSAFNRATPVLLLTTEADPAKKTAGREAGATGWLVKPFNPDKLVETVKKVCP
ncbi:two-component system chemotaxis response regulator CheY [Azospirillum brasilense]|uniref:Two-component system chemotaxis response regulator CheY n=1 Tax=Azospirillum brasilense TaxID=192 RepID=A0A560B9B5_AZOBR|nr:response regulator [Azospirillum brasilense]TWA69173.1 two-component system chemotaxis response regulator CheY [Azospirillum brasilense]